MELCDKSWKPLTFVTKSTILDFAVVLDMPLFRMGYSLVTAIEKEAPNRMKINRCIKFFTGFFQEFGNICTQAFSHQLCGPLLLAASVRYLILLLITANK